MKDSGFSLDGRFDRDSIAGMLEDMATGMRDGNLTLERDGDSLNLHPNSGVHLTVEAVQRHSEETIALRIQWKRG
ncbi:MAG: amphi-Trp domain-containing protein [bacterium]